MRMHLIAQHGAYETDGTPSKLGKQQTLGEAAKRAQSLQCDRETVTALAFCFNPTMTFNMANNHFFVQAFGQPCDRLKLPKAIMNVKNETLQTMQQKLKGARVTVCLDGWTNQWSHRKMLNIMLLHNGLAIFWRTIPMRFGKAAKVLFAMMKAAIMEYEATLDVQTIACVADNEASNRGLFTFITEWRPWILCLGCCAHGLQLVWKDIFNQSVLVKTAFRALD